MSENTIKELFRSLERTIAERLRVIDDLMRLQTPYNNPLPTGPTAAVRGPTGSEPWSVGLVQRISSLETEVRSLRAELDSRSPLIPQYPMSGIEVVPKKEVVLTETAPEPLSVADRLLLNTSALKALEQDEEDAYVAQEEEAEAEAEAEVEVEEEVEAEAEAEAEEEAEGEELEEFEYKGSTYYRDGDNNVFMADEEGELITTPVGVWSEVKKRIITKKAE
jgi:hypothetical protein